MVAKAKSKLRRIKGLYKRHPFLVRIGICSVALMVISHLVHSEHVIPTLEMTYILAEIAKVG